MVAFHVFFNLWKWYQIAKVSNIWRVSYIQWFVIVKYEKQMKYSPILCMTTLQIFVINHQSLLFLNRDSFFLLRTFDNWLVLQWYVFNYYGNKELFLSWNVSLAAVAMLLRLNVLVVYFTSGFSRQHLFDVHFLVTENIRNIHDTLTN